MYLFVSDDYEHIRDKKESEGNLAVASVIVLMWQLWQGTQPNLPILLNLCPQRESVFVSRRVSVTPGWQCPFSFPTGASSSHVGRPFHSHSLTTWPPSPTVPPKLTRWQFHFLLRLFNLQISLEAAFRGSYINDFGLSSKGNCLLGSVQLGLTQEKPNTRGKWKTPMGSIQFENVFSLSECLPIHPTPKHILVFWNIVLVSSSNPVFP